MPVKSIPIKLDKTRRLCFDFNAFAELQRECGLGILDVQKFVSFYILWEKGDRDAVYPSYEFRGFLWAGLLDESPNITLKEVGKMLDNCLEEERLNEVGLALGEALRESAFLKTELKKATGPKPTTVKKRTGQKKTSSKKTAS